MLAIVFNACLDLSHTLQKLHVRVWVCVCAGKENIACTTGTACRLPHTATTTTTTALLYNKAQHASDTHTERETVERTDEQGGQTVDGRTDKGAGGQTVGTVGVGYGTCTVTSGAEVNWLRQQTRDPTIATIGSTEQNSQRTNQTNIAKITKTRTERRSTSCVK